MSMSMQEIFTRSVVHLMRQNAKSVMLNSPTPPTFVPFQHPERCAYRGVDGLKCVVGALIPDELYDARMEGQSVSTGGLYDVLARAGVVEVGDAPGKMTMLYDLQRVHDLCAVSNWAERLQHIAKKYNLIMPDIDAIRALETTTTTTTETKELCHE